MNLVCYENEKYTNRCLCIINYRPISQIGVRGCSTALLNYCIVFYVIIYE